MSAAASGTMSGGMATKMGSAVGSTVVKNPMFAQAFAKGMWESIAGNEESASQQQRQQAQQQHWQQQQQPWIQQQQQQNRTQPPVEDNSINCSQEEYEAMQVAMRNLKWWYLGVASFMILTAFLSLTTLTVISSGFLAFYVLIFSCLMCCYELHWKVFTRFIVQNFGFMYNSPGRMSFTVFLGMLTWSLGIMGKVCFAFLTCAFCVEIYLRIKFPKFGEFMQKVHYYDTTIARHSGNQMRV